MKCTLMRIELREIQRMPSVFYVAFEFKAVLMSTEFWIKLTPGSFNFHCQFSYEICQNYHVNQIPANSKPI